MNPSSIVLRWYRHSASGGPSSYRSTLPTRFTTCFALYRLATFTGLRRCGMSRPSRAAGLTD